VYSTIMMKGLMFVYFVVALVCLCENNYPRALYWVSAGFLTTSILWGMK